MELPLTGCVFTILKVNLWFVICYAWCWIPILGSCVCTIVYSHIRVMCTATTPFSTAQFCSCCWGLLAEV